MDRPTIFEALLAPYLTFLLHDETGLFEDEEEDHSTREGPKCT